MNISTCIGCNRSKICAKKKGVLAKLKGTGVTSAKISCEERFEDFQPGTEVTFAPKYRLKIYEYGANPVEVEIIATARERAACVRFTGVVMSRSSKNKNKVYVYAPPVYPALGGTFALTRKHPETGTTVEGRVAVMNTDELTPTGRMRPVCEACLRPFDSIMDESFEWGCTSLMGYNGELLDTADGRGFLCKEWTIPLTEEEQNLYRSVAVAMAL
jgi:hypothetical protein